MSEFDDFSDDEFGRFVSDTSRRNSDIGFQPPGFEDPSLFHNAVVLNLSSRTIPGLLDIHEQILGRRFLGSGALFEVFGLVADVDPNLPQFDGPNAQIADHSCSDPTMVTASHRLVAVKRAKIVESRDIHGSCISIRTRTGDQADPDYISLIYNEVKALDQLPHPNIVKLLAWGFEEHMGQGPGQTSRSLVLVMEHALGSAERVLQEVQLPWPIRSHLCAGLVAGIKALHGYRIIHGDIKPDNVLIFSTTATDFGLVTKVADFNCSWDGTNIAQVPRGTFGWAAPDVETYDDLSQDLWPKLIAADSWSLGLTIWSMLFEGGARIPPSLPSQYAPKLALILEHADLSKHEFERLSPALLQTIDLDPSKRPKELDTLRRALVTAEADHL